MKRFFIAGYGNVGESCASILGREFKEVYVIDKRFKFEKEREIVTPKRRFKLAYTRKIGNLKFIAGNALNERLWRDLNLTQEDTVIIALPRDSDVIFCTLIVRNLCREATIIARANVTKNLEKIYRAGADYVAPLSAISAQSLVMSILRGKEIGEEATVYSGITIEKFTISQESSLRGLSLREADLRNKTGCTIIALLNEKDEIIHITPETILRAGMKIVAAGLKEDIEKLKALV